MVSSWPVFDEKLDFPGEKDDFEKIMGVIKAIRNRRAEMNVPPSKKVTVNIETELISVFSAGIPYICRLAYASEVNIAKEVSHDKSISLVCEKANVYMPMNELVDVEKELERLSKDRQKALVDKEFFEKKLNNTGFMAKAPEKVVEAQRDGFKKAEEKIAKIDAAIKELKNI